MSAFNIKEDPHTRFNLLTGEWVLVSPHRTKRPWNGKVEPVQEDEKPHYDPHCYLCPGNERAGGVSNPDYKEPYVFVNDYSALLPDTPKGSVNIGGLLKAESESGICKVVIFSPRHDLTLPQLSEEAIVKVIQTWTDQFRELSANPDIHHIQIFENKGSIMGCSNPHPHSQIWAQHSLPLEIVKETKQQKAYYETHNSSLLKDYLDLELKEKERIVLENDYFVALVPFWAVWPYETIVIPRRQIHTLLEFTEEEKKGYANILKRLTAKYDNLFHTSFPYSAGIHQSPVNDGPHPEWHLHVHFYPPLLRSATVKKFMVGYEMLANPQRDITAEWAAEKLRSLSDIRF